MMKLPISFISLAIISSAVLLFLPNVSGAQELSEREESVCEVLEQRASEIQKNLEERALAVVEVQAKHQLNISERRIKLGESAVAHRAKADIDRTIAINAMSEIAETKIEQAAVETYRQAVDAATAKRRDNFDAARLDFLNKLIDINQDHYTATEAAVLKFRTKVATTISYTRNACQQNTFKGVVHAEFVKGLQDARLGYISFRAELKHPRQGLKFLIEERSTVYKTIVTDFEEEMQTARDELRLVFK
ncbi:hypothetical protein H0V99_02530 [Candidatus Saccharibacteria bacterium]|nr:hypothetical protein [Candidatus Saccharibacteria bacterium]